MKTHTPTMSLSGRNSSPQIGSMPRKKRASRATLASLVCLLAVLVAPAAHSQYFTFDTDKQGWYSFGFGDGSTKRLIWGAQGPLLYWTQPDGDGAIALGFHGLTPSSPSGHPQVIAEFRSPSLTNSYNWQKAAAFEYEINCRDMYAQDILHVQGVVHVKTPDNRYGFHAEKGYYPLTCSNTGDEFENSWERFRVYLSNLDVPDGSTILGIAIRVFFGGGEHYDGYIYVDNVSPLSEAMVLLKNSYEVPDPLKKPVIYVGETYGPLVR